MPATRAELRVHSLHTVVLWVLTSGGPVDCLMALHCRDRTTSDNEITDEFRKDLKGKDRGPIEILS
jgi:hypothetical protein